jgi:hypothetical protein
MRFIVEHKHFVATSLERVNKKGEPRDAGGRGGGKSALFNFKEIF